MAEGRRAVVTKPTSNTETSSHASAKHASTKGSWIAQWKEMIDDPAQKIGRPRQLYTGPTERAYVPIDNRK